VDLDVAAVREIFQKCWPLLPATGVIDDYRGARLVHSLLGWTNDAAERLAPLLRPVSLYFPEFLQQRK
jgi:hypothetical protein